MATSSAFLRAIVVFVVAAACSSPAAARRLVPAMYVFGDSTADVGNNNYLPGNDAKANFYPYGIDYPGGIATGRFCNGYVGVDFLAMRLGFKKSPPAALSVKTASKESRGVNYASGGSGVLDLTGQNESISLNKQIELFRATAGRLEKKRGRQHARLLLSKSIFIFSTFNNDLFALIRANPLAATNATVQDLYISTLTSIFGQQLTSLHYLGARKMIVSGTGPLGCPPLLRALTPAGDCFQPLNVISQKFNIAMKKKMRALSHDLKGLHYSYLNTYNTTLKELEMADQFGFKELKSACCGNGFLNAATVCLPNSTICSNRNAYLSWDYVHPTQASYKHTIDLIFSATPGLVEPISLLELVKQHKD